MAVNCRINNGIVEAPNGKVSKLYKSLEEKLGSDKALELYYLTDTMDYKDISTLDVDENGEMLTNAFLRFALSSDSLVDFTKEAVELVQKFPQEKLAGLDKLYVEGIFKATQNTLKSTGLFSEDEILEVVYSTEKQQDLKAFIENLEEVEATTVEDFRVEEDVYNKIGVKPLKNPEQVQEHVLSLLIGSEGGKDLDDLVQTLPYPTVIDKYNSDPTFRDNLRRMVDNAVVVPVEQDSDMTLMRLYNTTDVESFGDISDTTRRIDILNDKDLIVEEFEVLVDSLVEAGVEIDFDEASLLSKTTEELKNFSSALQAFVDTPTEQTAQEFANVVEEFSEKEEEKVITNFSNPYVDRRTLRFFDTTKDEISAFESNSLIKLSENVYVKVKDAYEVGQLYEFLFDRVMANPSFRWISKAISSEKQISNIDQLLVAEDIRNVVRDNTKFLPFADVEIQEKITIYKIFYGAPINKHASEAVATPVENQEYLTGDFMSNFNKERLSAKRAELETYNNFFKHFKVDHKGIRLVHDNSFSVETVLANIPFHLKTDLLDYSRISEHLDLGQESFETDMTNTARLKAQQNPNSVKRLEKDYQIAEFDEIITEETEQFINLRGDVYEKALSYADKNLYKRLPKSNNVFKNTNIEKPVPNKSPKYLRDFVVTRDNTVTNKQHLSKEELIDINEKHFECV